jgi:hypothetical protein
LRASARNSGVEFASRDSRPYSSRADNAVLLHGEVNAARSAFVAGTNGADAAPVQR